LQDKVVSAPAYVGNRRTIRSMGARRMVKVFIV